MGTVFSNLELDFASDFCVTSLILADVAVHLFEHRKKTLYSRKILDMQDVRKIQVKIELQIIT